MRYELKSERDDSVTIDGLGVLEPGQMLVADEDAASRFKNHRGLPIASAGLPEGITVTVVVGEVK